MPSTASAASNGGVTVQRCNPDGVHDYLKVAGTHYSGWYSTGDCTGEIKIAPDTNRYIKVCFYPQNADNYCQSSYKLATANRFKTIATDVGNGTLFKFYFRSTARSTGQQVS
ncbi:hypothetical protein [Streptomyces capitiformicae]|nr:hypothetical protein [Streptomyces capitiformicae]